MSLAGLESLDPEQAMSPLALVYPNLDYVITYKTAAQNRFTGASFLCFLLALSQKLYLPLLRRKEWKEILLFISMLPVLQIH